MRYEMQKVTRFCWRAGRNLLCSAPWGRSLLFPAQSLASHFGRGDADYALGVFLHHHEQLTAAGFPGATRILEVGPGRNLGTSLLMWALNQSRTGKEVTVYLWDVFRNMVVDTDTLAEAARVLLESPKLQVVVKALPDNEIEPILARIAQGAIQPDIRYYVKTLPALMAAGNAKNLALVYSHAAIEHIWHIEEFWRAIIRLTRPGGWHSHRIDLADHGRRNTNYIEMLEWSSLGYWLTMRFVPGAINRWRASVHLDFLTGNGLRILSSKLETRDELPIPRARINKRFQFLSGLDLRTTAVDVVGIKAG